MAWFRCSQQIKRLFFSKNLLNMLIKKIVNLKVIHNVQYFVRSAFCSISVAYAWYVVIDL